MTTIFKTLAVALVFCSVNSTAQQIFKDSGQRLGNSVSWDIMPGDLDGDGDLDAVMANWNFGQTNQENEIWLNDGHGYFTKASQELGCSQNIQLFDIDFDGDLDIIDNQIWLNNGNANFTVSNKYIFEGWSITFDRKINASDQAKAITIESNGDSNIVRIYSIDTSAFKIENTFVVKHILAQNIAVGDLNNDDYSDIVLCQDGPNFILFNDKTGNFVVSDQQLTGTYNTVTVTLADLNGDGYSDLLQGNYHHPALGTIYPVKLYLNDTTGHFYEAPLPYHSSYLTYNPKIADFDNDGDLDIFMNHGHAFDFSQKSEILFNDGYANFTASTINLEMVKSISLASGDLDNDGDLDLFLACGDANGIANPNRVWFNTTISTLLETTTIKEPKVFPNPTTSQFTISFGSLPVQKAIAEIYTNEGKLILAKSYQNQTTSTIDLTGFQSGIYVVKVIADGLCFEEKIIKE